MGKNDVINPNDVNGLEDSTGRQEIHPVTETSAPDVAMADRLSEEDDLEGGGCMCSVVTASE